MEQKLLAKPPWRKSGKRLESMCRKALYDFDLLQDVDRLAIALSGGKDSLTLLYLLNAIRGKGFKNFDIHAIHVSGAFSCGPGVQENYLKRICEQLSIPLTICHTEQKLETLKCYSCSRNRRKLIFDAAKNQGIETIAFGHHRDDNIQTLLMNLLHKAEFAGNLPKLKMIDYDVTIIRPLIYVSEEEIQSFARSYQFARISCQCPVGQNSMRRKVADMIDEIEQIFPNVKENLAQAMFEYGSKKALYK